MKKTRILYVVSHAIQYQAPLLRLIAKSPDITIKTIFYANITAESNFDAGFGQAVKWDVPLLSGYEYHYLSNGKKHQKTIQKLIDLWKEINPKKLDVVWTHGYKDIFTVAAICFAKLKGLKVFVRGESMLFPDKTSKLKTIERKLFFRLLNKLVNRFLAIGTNNRDFYLTYGVPSHKITLCHYTVDNDFFKKKYLDAAHKSRALKTHLGLTENRPIILYASKFISRKRPIDLLKAYIQLSKNNEEPTPYLLFIGNGNEYDTIKNMAAQHGWDSIRFLGFKNQSELPDYYAISDVLVLPSLHENWGLVINEAMNAKCAIIVSDHIGCAQDLVQDTVNGYVYPAQDVNMLSKYLDKITSDTKLCEAMKIKSAHIISHWGLTETLSGLRTACRSTFASL